MFLLSRRVGVALPDYLRLSAVRGQGINPGEPLLEHGFSEAKHRQTDDTTSRSSVPDLFGLFTDGASVLYWALFRRDPGA